jgi:hypothetical protein
MHTTTTWSERSVDLGNRPRKQAQTARKFYEGRYTERSSGRSCNNSKNPPEASDTSTLARAKYQLDLSKRACKWQIDTRITILLHGRRYDDILAAKIWVDDTASQDGRYHWHNGCGKKHESRQVTPYTETPERMASSQQSRITV